MIARKSLLVVISQFLTRTLGYVGLVVIAKLWGSFAPTALGDIGWAMSFIGVFYIIADLGFGQAHVKKISEGNDLGTCISTFFTIKLILTTIMVILALFTIFFLDSVLHLGFKDATKQSVVLVFLLYYTLASIQQIASYTFNGKGEIAKMQITSVFENILKVPLSILVAIAGVGLIGLAPAIAWPSVLEPLRQFLAGHPIGSLAMAYVFGIAATVVVGFWLLRKNPWKRPSVELGKGYATFAMPILLYSILSTVSANIDKLMIGFFWTDKEVGYYFSLQQILQIILIISVAFNTVLFPVYSGYHSKKDIQKINSTTKVVERYISMIVIPPIVIIIVFVNAVISIMLTSAFLPAASTFVILSIYAVLASFLAPFYSLLVGMNKPGLFAKIGLGISLINIALNFLLIPKWGLLTPVGINGPTGAAVALVLSNLVGFVWIRLAAKKLTGIQLLQIHTPRHIIAGAAMGLVLYVIAFRTGLFPLIHWYHLLLFVGIGLLVYLAVLYLLREFTKSDFDFFLELLHPKKMLQYIKTEVKEEQSSDEKR
ncbi:MAG TPA: flippase [Candidatus Thermoplasmatota archaeon]|nr:flippase [Candidatus Thermoplasmatota archaeon]